MENRNLQFLHWNHYKHSEKRVNKYFNGYCSIQLMSQGGVELFYGDHKHELTGRWYWGHFPGPLIRLHVSPSFSWWEHRYVAFQGPLVNEFLNEGLIPQSPIPAFKDSDEEKFDELLAAVNQRNAWSHRKAVNLLENLLIDLSEYNLINKTNTYWLKKVLNELNYCSGHPDDYLKICQKIGISLPTLRKKFREAMGISLHAHVLNMRICRAQNLLAESNIPIKQIAIQLGYSDVQFFGRQFKKLVGVTPASYRKRS